jgi:RHS repeat-associated protein
MITDESGGVAGTQDHLPFGEDAGVTGENEKHRFTNYERDSESGTDYAVNRQYANNTGRFLRPDPVGGSIADPQCLNRYAYAGNDPVNLVDPMGLDPIWPDWGGGGIIDDWGARFPELKAFFDMLINFALLPDDKKKALLDALKAVIGLQISEDCQKNVIDKLAKLPGFDLDKFKTYLEKGGAFLDGFKSKDTLVPNVMPNEQTKEVLFGNATTVGQTFADINQSALTSLTSPTLKVYVNPSRVNPKKPKNLAALVFHEGLHGYGGVTVGLHGKNPYGDGRLAAALGITVGYNNFGSVAITDYIQKNCFPGKDGK